ncbi:TlpA family protein disulfide reductase [Asaia krungthepensis]|uniref:Thiol-disulfide oxidoreductase ResA n=1 Tax=Asaia krungthepensis NRIC 0535 TaxID=1307925 RepID=A0ABQ0Q2A3_9PROT|nr:redoxin domain-containing protein [Asaia krungthepensis]GBQ87979.1 thiol-disulfide oxidoreductase ResA [Asaia krungthepensis NRIC 0535]
MPSFRHGLTALALLALCSATSSACAETPPAPDAASYIAEDPALKQMIGRPVPAMSWQTLDGQTLDMEALTRKGPVYLKLWATYCIPCRAQMPGFEALYQRYQSRMSVVAVDIGFGDTREKVAAFVRNAGLTMPVVVDDGSLSNWLAIRATPLHVMIDRDGRLAYIGHQDGPVLEAALERIATTPRRAKDLHFADVTRIQPLEVGARVPDVKLTDAAGSETSLRPAIPDSAQVVIFSAPWCESYLATMDPPTARACTRVRELAQKLMPRSGIAWTVIGARLWTEPGDMAAFRTLFGPGFRVLLDRDNRAFTRFGVRQIPAIALITKDGHLARILDGSRLDLEEQVEAFAQDSR